VKISSIETFTRGAISVVRLTTDDGAQGYGQIAPFHADISATVLHRQVAPVAERSVCQAAGMINTGSPVVNWKGIT